MYYPFFAVIQSNSMKKKVRVIHHAHQKYPIRWLPIDSRLLTPIFKFGSVKGTARFFLELEITFAIFIVSGTLILAGMKIVQILVK